MAVRLTSARSGRWSRFNNQDTVLLRLAHALNDHESLSFGIFHESRIFFFSVSREASLEEAIEDVESNLLTLLTLPKYRIFTSIYMIYRLIDNACLYLLLFIATKAYLFESHGNIIDFDNTTEVRNLVVISLAIGNEFVFTALENTSRLWIMQRMLPYIGLAIYGAYVLVFDYLAVPKTVWLILGFRFFGFVCEHLVDFFIDIEIHHDFEANGARELPFCCWMRCCHHPLFANWSLSQPDTNAFELNTVGVEAIHFVGSQSAWHLRAADSWRIDELGTADAGRPSGRRPYDPCLLRHWCRGDGESESRLSVRAQRDDDQCCGGWEAHRLGLVVLGLPVFSVLLLSHLFIAALTAACCCVPVCIRWRCFGAPLVCYRFPQETVVSEIRYV